MAASKIVRPDVIYKDSFICALPEYHQNCHLLRELDYAWVKHHFEDFVADLNDENGQHHKNLEPWAERVKENIFWLVKDTEFLGYVKIRQRVNWHLERFGGHISFSIRPDMRSKGFGKKLLQKTLPIIPALGIDKALLTVSPDNAAAIRIIEFCGGEFQDETAATDRFPAQLRYWMKFE